MATTLSTEALGNAVAPPDPPSFVNIKGEPITSLEPGQQAMIVYTFENHEDEPKAFLGLFEVRDSDGVTQLIAWQSAVMPAADANSGVSGNTTIGVSWLPTKASTYEARVFAISSFQNTQIIMPIARSEIVAK
jgi:hypothetical protein